MLKKYVKVENRMGLHDALAWNLAPSTKYIFFIWLWIYLKSAGVSKCKHLQYMYRFFSFKS